MLKLISPGDLVADVAGLADEHRAILRMFINTLVWGAIAVAIGVYISG